MKKALHVDDVAAILARKYGDFNHYNKKNPLDELIFILCSVRTEERLYLPVYKSIKRHFRSAWALYNASLVDMERVLRPGGLSRAKAKYIKIALDMIVRKFGRPSLASLKRWPDEECEVFLTSLPNVGKKVARCIMLYSLEREVFPVDVHCWRICRRLGWIRSFQKDGKPSAHDMDRLQSKIPKTLRYSLHVNMLSHGRRICTKKNPQCSICVISRSCRKVNIRV